ncbi:MAG: type II toxin-antitoxin system VapC family toxin [Actinomycetota bacterium]|nr:type II toxin-antitoxin system VapC family toxin [Actinomycetota bacterium]
MSAVLDTTVLIDVLRGHQAAVEYVVALEEVPACSEVTRVEVLRGLHSGERASAEPLFQRLRWVPVDEAIARAAGELGRRLRRSHSGVGVADLVIAATADQIGLPLATTNVRHFPMVKGLRPPYPD